MSTSYADIDRPCGEKEVAFTLPASSVADGVLRITVFGPDGNPVLMIKLYSLNSVISFLYLGSGASDVP